MLLRKTKDSYYKQYFEDNKKNLRLVWQTIKGIIYMKKESGESISSLLIDSELITSANFLSPTLAEDIEDLIKSMKTNKASDPNSIPTKILKLLKKKFSKPLSDIINLSFNQGIFPNLRKIANVIPIHKKVTSLTVITTDLFLFYLTLVKFMKNVCTLVSQIFSK